MNNEFISVCEHCIFTHVHKNAQITKYNRSLTQVERLERQKSKVVQSSSVSGEKIASLEVLNQTARREVNQLKHDKTLLVDHVAELQNKVW